MNGITTDACGVFCLARRWCTAFSLKTADGKCRLHNDEDVYNKTGTQSAQWSCGIRTAA